MILLDVPFDVLNTKTGFFVTRTVHKFDDGNYWLCRPNGQGGFMTDIKLTEEQVGELDMSKELPILELEGVNK